MSVGMFKGFCAGAVGGLAGAWVMQQVRVRWDARSAANPRNGIFGFDEEADLKSVERLCQLLGKPVPSKAEGLRVALALHYGYGVLSGGAYGVMAELEPGVTLGFGTGFGTALWMVGDEIAITASGLSNPLAREAASHISALAVHLLFGGVVEWARRQMVRAVDSSH